MEGRGNTKRKHSKHDTHFFFKEKRNEYVITCMTGDSPKLLVKSLRFEHIKNMRLQRKADHDITF